MVVQPGWYPVGKSHTQAGGCWAKQQPVGALRSPWMDDGLETVTNFIALSLLEPYYTMVPGWGYK